MSTFAQLQRLSRIQPELIPISKKKSARKRQNNKNYNLKNGLPLDIWKLICSNLSSKNIIFLSQTCTLFKIFPELYYECIEEMSMTWHSMIWTARYKARSTVGQFDYGSIAIEEVNLACSVYPEKYHSLKVEYAYNTRGLSFYRWYLNDQCEGCTDG